MYLLIMLYWRRSACLLLTQSERVMLKTRIERAGFEDVVLADRRRRLRAPVRAGGLRVRAARRAQRHQQAQLQRVPSASG